MLDARVGRVQPVQLRNGIACVLAVILVIFLVGLVLTIVRAQKDSVAASLLMHVAYNGTLSSLMFIATDGFRHLERLNQ